MRDTIQKYIEDGMKSHRDRTVVYTMLGIIALCVVFIVFWLLSAPAQTAEITCTHHICDESCSYVPATDEYWECTHQHTEECYTETSGSSCRHQHSEAAGCTPVTADEPVLGENGEPTGEVIAVATDNWICRHTDHDSTCGYAEPGRILNCQHQHGEGCVYHQADEGQLCSFDPASCEICAAERGGEVNQGATAKISVPAAYKSGDPIQFILSTSYAHAGTSGITGDEYVTIRVKITSTGSDDYRLITDGECNDPASQYNGWKTISVAAGSQGSPAKTLYYDPENGIIEYSLKSGDTGIVGYIDFIYPNGTTENGSTLTLTPEVAEGVEGNHILQSATTEVTAAFGWSEVSKVVRSPSDQSLGDASGGYRKTIYYTIDSSNLNASAKTGVAYTEKLVIKDRITFDNLYFDFGGQVPKANYSTYYGGWEYYIDTGVGSNKYYFLRVAVPQADKDSIKIKWIPDERAGKENHIIGFDIEYTITNPDKDNSDLISIPKLVNVNNGAATIALYASNASYFFYDAGENLETNAKGDTYAINNHVDFRAESIHYGPTDDDPDEENYCESSDDAYLAGTSSLSLTKYSYSPSANPGVDLDTALQLTGTTGATSSGTMYSGEYRYFRIVFKNSQQFYETLYLSDIMFLADTGNKFSPFEAYDFETKAFDPNEIEFVGIGVKNRGDMTYKEDGWDAPPVLGTYTYDGNLGDPDYTSKGGIPSAYMYKEFKKVPVGAEISLVYRVKVRENPTYGAVRNFAIASTGINPETCKYKDILKAHYITIYTERESAKVQLTKSFVDEKGNPVQAADTYYYNVGDTVYYGVSIENKSGSDITLKYLQENWPYQGVYLDGVTGLNPNENLEIYSSTANSFSGSYLQSFDSEAAKSISHDKETSGLYSGNAYNARYLVIKGMTIPAGKTRTIIFRGTVYGEVSDGIKNTVSAQFDDGSGTGSISITFQTEHSAINATKRAYRLKPTDGVYDWKGGTLTASGYEEGDVVRYEIDVTNNSMTKNTMQNILIEDIYDTIFSGKSPMTVTYGGEEGEVFVQYADGTVEALNELVIGKDNKYSGLKGYNLSGCNLTAAVNDAGLEPRETMKFIFFLKIDEEVRDKYNELSFTEGHDWGFRNDVTAEGWSKPDHSDAVSSKTQHDATMKEALQDRSAVVTKTHYATLYGLTEANGRLTYTGKSPGSADTGVKVGDYIAYEVKILNTSKSGTDNIKLYGFKDTLPAGTRFVATTDYVTLVNGMEGGNIPVYFPDGSGRVSLSLGNTDGRPNQRVELKAETSYDSATRTLSIDFLKTDGEYFYEDNSISPPWYISIIVIAEVTENYQGYTNTGGYIIDGSVQTKSNDSQQAGEGKKYVHASAQVNGPVYYAGITKSVSGYYLDGKLQTLKNNTYVSILPKYPIMWSVNIKNGLNSTTAIDKFQIVDILPAEFKYRPGSSTLMNVPIGDPEIDEREDGTKKLTWTVSGASLAPGAELTLQFVTEWDGDTTGNANGIYGIYQNEATLVLGKEYPLKGAVSGQWDSENNSITDYAQVNMLGSYGTTSYKTVQNITAASPHNGQQAQGVNTTGVISALAGDEIRYTLNITNQSGGDSQSGHEMKNVVIIDTLPHVGDKGVVNKAIERKSAFDVNFTDTPNVAVSILRANGVTEPVAEADFTYDFRYVGPDGTLSKNDWNGTAAWSPGAGGADSIRIILKNNVKVNSGDTIIVTFNAVVAGAAGAETKLPSSGDIAWNSFGYAYEMDGSGVLYAEPIKVGVKIPYAYIDVSKTVVDENDIEVESDSTGFTFKLERKLPGDAGWTAAGGIRYTYAGENTVNMTGADGTFTLRHGQKIVLYAPSGYIYKVTETDLPEGYELISGSYEPGTAVAEDASISVSFKNERERDKWDVTLRKVDEKGDELKGAKFTLEKQDGENGWTEIVPETEVDAHGVLEFKALAAGTYRITETKSPDGYNKLEGPVVFALPYDEQNTGSSLPRGVTMEALADGSENYLLTVENTGGYELPEAGGAGTMAWITTGLMLMLGSGFGFMRVRKRRKRRSAN